jgi:acetyltransferase
MTKRESMKQLFQPQSVAVIGASSNEKKLGYKILQNVISCGYKGEIYPISPKGGEILGLSVSKSVLEIESEIDFAVVVVPHSLVLSVVRELVQKRVKFAEIITSGFREIGNIEEEEQIVAVAKAGNLRFLGPNMFGIYSRTSSLNATFGSKAVQKGSVAVITQSGAIGVAMIGKTEVENIGLSAIVSLGNKADLNEADILDYLENDPYTKTILLYIEGIKGGERVLESFKRVARKKPIIVLKSGTSKRGALAVASHTGALAGSDKLFNEIMKQSGVLRVFTMGRGVHWSQFLSNSPMPQGLKTLIITNGGGLGALATDSAEKWDVELLDDDFSGRYGDVGAVASECGSFKNPIDITGGADREAYQKTLRLAFEDPKVDAIIVLGTEVAVFSAEEIEEMISEEFKRGFPKPVVFSFVGGKEMEERVLNMRKRGIPIFEEINEAVSSLGAMFRFYRNILRSREEVIRKEIPTEKISEIVKVAKSEGRFSLLQNEGKEVLDLLEISNPKSFVAETPESGVAFSEEIGFPVVMKVVSKDILHKSDAGGVFLGVKCADEVSEKFEKILENAKEFDSSAEVSGIEISETATPSTEVILGARRDPQFGTTIMAGVGGTMVEVFNDVSFRSFPLSKEETIRMFKSSHLHKILSGVRGEKPRDIETLIDTVLKLGEVVESRIGISDIELNPVFAYENGIQVVDVRVILE